MNNNYSRRKFMKTVVVSAGAVGAGGLAGCGGENEINADEKDDSIDVVSPSKDFNATIYPQSVASGDPRSNSIVLWTRVSNGLGEQEVYVQVATDEDFNNVVAQAELTTDDTRDHCVNVKVTDLSSYKRYYYRFITDGYPSKTGRFRTAPSYNGNEDIKFGFVSCQDYRNGYYNSLLKFLEDDNDDLDFIVHLGDYIYEKDGAYTRTVSFTDNTGSIATSSDNAAVTMEQYRDIYKTYRSDPALQRVHEKFPMIHIWDDHEFSNDAWQNNGTYFGGMTDEESTSRRENAETVFFEYMPIDIDPSSGNLLDEGQVNQSDVYPSNIYRKLRFGQRLDLTMTDYRTYRPDHLIPEDAYPGTVVMTEIASGQTLYSVPGDAFGFKAGVDGTLNAISGGAITQVADIKNPTPTETAVIRGAVRQAVAGGLTLVPYVNIDNVTNAMLGNFLAALNSTLTTLNGINPAILPFSASPTPTLKELLIYALAAAYQDNTVVPVALTQPAAVAKAAGVVDGNIDCLSINGTLTTLYNGFLTTVNAIGGGLGLPVPFANFDDMFTALAAHPAINQPNLVTQSGVSQKFVPDLIDDTGSVGEYDNNDDVAGGLAGLSDNDAEGVLLAGLDNNSNGSFADMGDIPPDSTWGFEGFGVSYAILGKTALAAEFGSRYLVVKPTYELLNLYHGLVLETDGFGIAWGDQQQTGIFVALNTSTADWNVLGSSVSFTSMILDASNGSALDTVLDGAGVPESTLPRTQFFMNVDQWDGFPLTRATFMNDASGNLAAANLGTFQDNNVVVLSGDIHGAFITDHSANPEGTGRCLEFTVPGVSSESFGSFTATAIAGLLGAPVNHPNVVGLVSGLDTFLDLGNATMTTAPQDIEYVNTSVNGVGIIELTANQLTGSMHMLHTTGLGSDPTLLTTNAYNAATTDAEWSAAAAAFTGNFTTVTRTSTKASNGQNGELT